MCRHVEVAPARLTAEFSYPQERLVASMLAFSHLELESIAGGEMWVILSCIFRDRKDQHNHLCKFDSVFYYSLFSQRKGEIGRSKELHAYLQGGFVKKVRESV